MPPSFRAKALLLVLLVGPVPARAVEPSFLADVAPLLRSRCLKCHSGKTRRGDLVLTSRQALLDGGATGPALKPGKPEESLLFRHVRDGKMPPKTPLPDAEVDLLRRWIAAGGKWEGPDLRPVQAV